MASTAPTTNSRGEQVWNPAVGIYHKPGAKYSESYGGIVAALQDLIVESTGSASEKGYPANFAGIIAAIQDLDLGENKPGSGIGDTPPGSEIIVGNDGRPDFIVNIRQKMVSFGLTPDKGVCLLLKTKSGIKQMVLMD